MSKLQSFSFWCLVSFLAVPSVFAQVLINEFQIEPDQQVELFNNSNEIISLDNWIIDDSGGTTFYTIPTNTQIAGNSCLVFSSNFNLNRSSPDTIRLINPNQELVDSHDYEKSPGESQSLGRLLDGENNWVSLPSSLGKMNSTGESCLFNPTPSPTGESAVPTSTPTPQPTPTSPTGESDLPEPTNIFLNEVLPNPEGESEWVELYNDNSETVNLQDWYLDDGEDSGSLPKKFTLQIEAHGYGVVELTSAIFNNDKDTARLLSPNKIEVDSFEYNNSQKEQSYSRQSLTEDIWCKTEPTKNAKNNSCLNFNAGQILGASEILPTLTLSQAKQSSPMRTENPINLRLKTSFYPLSSLKPALARIKKSQPQNNPKIRTWQRFSSILSLLNLGLNLTLLLYILWYYDRQKNRALSFS